MNAKTARRFLQRTKWKHARIKAEGFYKNNSFNRRVIKAKRVVNEILF